MLNLNPARGTLTSRKLLWRYRAWLGTPASAQQPAPPPQHDAPYLGEVRNQYTETSGAPQAVCQGPQHDYRSRQSGAVCHQ